MRLSECDPKPLYEPKPFEIRAKTFIIVSNANFLCRCELTKLAQKKIHFNELNFRINATQAQLMKVMKMRDLLFCVPRFLKKFDTLI